MEPETDDAAEAALRLEEALERIARVATGSILNAAGRTANSGPAPQFDRSELTARLDSLIADIRQVLADQPE